MAKKITALANVKLSPANYNEWAGWDDLNSAEQRNVQREGKGLAEAMLAHGQSRLAIGEHLTNLQTILEPHGLFGRFLTNFHFSRRTAYRIIAGYKHATKMLPPAVVENAMRRGINIVGETTEKPLGIYTDAVKALPPPKQATAQTADRYLDQLEAARKEVARNVSVPKLDTTTACKQCYITFKNAYRRLPGEIGSKTRLQFLRTLIGLQMTEAGLSSAQTFHPEAIPEGFRTPRGYPKGRPRK